MTNAISNLHSVFCNPSIRDFWVPRFLVNLNILMSSYHSFLVPNSTSNAMIDSRHIYSYEPLKFLPCRQISNPLLDSHGLQDLLQSLLLLHLSPPLLLLLPSNSLILLNQVLDSYFLHWLPKLQAPVLFVPAMFFLTIWSLVKVIITHQSIEAGM